MVGYIWARKDPTVNVRYGSKADNQTTYKHPSIKFSFSRTTSSLSVHRHI